MAWNDSTTANQIRKSLHRAFPRHHTSTWVAAKGFWQRAWKRHLSGSWPYFMVSYENKEEGFVHNPFCAPWQQMVNKTEALWATMSRKILYVWYNMIWFDIWYDVWYDIWYMIWYDIRYNIWYDVIRCMIWCNVIRYDMCMTYMMWYDVIWYVILKHNVFRTMAMSAPHGHFHWDYLWC